MRCREFEVETPVVVRDNWFLTIGHSVAVLVLVGGRVAKCHTKFDWIISSGQAPVWMNEWFKGRQKKKFKLQETIMKFSPIKILRSLSILLPLLAVACGPLYYTPNPDTNPMEPIIEFQSAGSINLVNGQPSTEEIQYWGRKDGPGGAFANFNAWTDTAIAIANRELSQRGLSISGDGEKSLKLEIFFVKTTSTILTLEYKTVVKMKVETGSGYAAEYVGINKSFYLFDLKRQSDGAVMRTVVAMLQDQKIIDYLTGQ